MTRVRALDTRLCRSTEVETPQEQSRPSKVWRWRAPWQQDHRVPTLRARAAESSIRRWQVCGAFYLHSIFTLLSLIGTLSLILWGILYLVQCASVSAQAWQRSDCFACSPL